jgi:hypothetical protein
MNDLRIHRILSDEEISKVLGELAEDFEGRVDTPGPGERAVLFTIQHRFHSGALTARVRWEYDGADTVLRAEVDNREAGVTHAGKSLLILGAVAVLPPMLCWYFPSLMPMVPLALLLMFLSWLAVARKPAYFTPEFYLRRLQNRLGK